MLIDLCLYWLIRMQYYIIILNNTNISNGKCPNVEKFSDFKINSLIISRLLFLINAKVFQFENYNLRVIDCLSCFYFSEFSKNIQKVWVLECRIPHYLQNVATLVGGEGCKPVSLQPKAERSVALGLYIFMKPMRAASPG